MMKKIGKNDDIQDRLQPTFPQTKIYKKVLKQRKWCSITSVSPPNIKYSNAQNGVWLMGYASGGIVQEVVGPGIPPPKELRLEKNWNMAHGICFRWYCSEIPSYAFSFAYRV
ncbi:hypothetical protein CTI12_AA532790 [Artemisia annua]|uniref:Uncharacterized protein n=1 Tax=Artemisia annua TaxID=35608 RepID=A0A2U1KZ16_ARTAN|nr:hypothetical protein CTI12_AA532790 [Artemisia annua]